VRRRREQLFLARLPDTLSPTTAATKISDLMSRLHIGVPLWLTLASGRRHRRYRSLKRHLSVDVVIVGGGLTGAAIAWTFASAGVRVALLEAAGVGCGSTGASTAMLMQEPDEDFAELTGRYGAHAARRIWQLSQWATREFIATLRRLDIVCDLSERDSMYYATRPDAVASLRAEYRRRRAAGFGGRWLDARALRRAAGISGSAAIRTRGNAQLDPFRACLGLLRAAERNGAYLFEHSAVHRIERTPAGVRAVTRHGTIKAQRVVIATGYATPEFRPLTARFRMKHTYVLATRPIDARTRTELGVGDVMLWDTDRPYHYARWTRDHRLLLGGGDRPQVSDARRARAFREGRDTLRTYFETLFPALAGIDIEYAWEGLFAMTPDGLPYIGPHRHYPGHLFALGYGGNGMTYGFLAARLLLDWFRGIQSADYRLFAFGRHR
jgi:glycine/D-amino acid oxidase-like deaminating enzyme